MQDFFSHTTPFQEIPLIDALRNKPEFDILQVPKHAFRVKLSVANKRYAELDIFRQQIEHSKAGLHHQLYTQYKKSMRFYKSVFFGFSTLFSVLGFIIMKLHISMGCSLFFSCSFLKTLVVSFCFLLGLLSFVFACTMRTDREAVLHAVRKAKTSLGSIYARKRVKLGINRFFAFGLHRRRSAALRQMYHEIREKINDKKEEALHLVNRISTAQTLNKGEKEVLLNQAIEELNDKLILLTHTFRHSTLPHFVE